MDVAVLEALDIVAGVEIAPEKRYGGKLLQVYVPQLNQPRVTLEVAMATLKHALAW